MAFVSEIAANLPQNKQWAEQLLECERELVKAEMGERDDVRIAELLADEFVREAKE